MNSLDRVAASLSCCLVSSSRIILSWSRMLVACWAAWRLMVSLSEVVMPARESVVSTMAAWVSVSSSSVMVGLKCKKIMAPSTPATAKAMADVKAMMSRNMARETSDPRMPPAMSPVIPGVSVMPWGVKVGSPVRGMMVVPTKAPMASPKRKKTGLMTRAPTSQRRSPAMSAVPRGTDPPSGNGVCARRMSVLWRLCMLMYCWDAGREILRNRPNNLVIGD